MLITLATKGVVPCKGYGGIERQVDWLATELVRQGHRVVLVAGPGSSHPLCEVRHAVSDAECRAAIPKDTQIVHLHAWKVEVDFPTLNTERGHLPDYPRPQPNWSFISARHAQLHGRKTFVYNGFPVDDYRLAESKSDRLLFMAAIARAGKGLNRAVELARKFDFPLDIAGGSRWKLLGRSRTRREGVFFKSLSRRYRFNGVVDGDDKLRLLGASKAFLNPIAWEEPFGNAPVEAMLCGTPVLTTARGALPETVDTDTGRFFESDEEFAEGLAEVADLCMRKCRESAADRFPIAKTAKAYLELYARILDGEALP
ncbi:MAG: glycosyltransferase family 4 protein [Mesorhizobium sp.]|nr:glycosyltransferase [Mesorhizobium sp. M1A.F.Ca.IN.022.06.1.1]RUV62168.1 glycosyltransferase [Mesorhizobium sp. M1A.F.Ca.IN.022.02.1.1]RUV70396.1 glycosyltransferase [Mesorhizobium sp. M1A.F.Ca.IN.020.30.1.1]RWG24133.1 MAG: glycosyltransferase [Mesorhizobium sp.]RWG40206.1 MAG: glycosyltransferase [Mesorhizobium sp.]